MGSPSLLSLSLQSIGSSENDVLALDNEHEHQVNELPPTTQSAPSLHHSTSPRRTTSRVSLASLATRIKSSASRKTNTVPKTKRRGLFAFLAVIPEYEDARDYTRRTKLIIVFIIAFAAITGPMGTSIMLPAIDDVAKDLHTSTSTVNLSVGIYLLSLGIFPLWWSALSESLGRRTIYVISFILFCGFSIGASLSPSIGTLIAFRVLCGGCSASVQAVGAGTIGDLFIQQERGVAMGIYYLGPLMGPFLAPILGGVVSQAWGWRATQWLMVIFSGCNVVLILFGLPETLRKQDNATAVRDLLRKQLAKENTDYEEGMGDGREHNEDGSEKDETVHNKRAKSTTPDTGENGIPANVTNTTGAHDYTDVELERIATNLSRSISRRSGPRADEEEFILDGMMPTLSRLNTNKSAYSRKLTEQQKSEFEAAILEAAEEKDRIEEEVDKTLWKEKLYNYAIRPMHSLVLLRYPPVALVISFSSVCFSVIYFFNMSITYEYGKEPYHFKSIIIGLLYIPNSVTYVIASILGGKWNDRLLRKYAEKHDGDLVPESRLSWNLVTAVCFVPPACLIFGWCLQYKEHWVVPLVGTACFGFASMLIIGATVTYLVDVLPGKGATGVALNNLVRMILAAIATFVVEPAIKGIGPGKLFTILMCVLILSSGSIIIVKLKGNDFRKNYDLGKLYDLL